VKHLILYSALLLQACLAGVQAQGIAYGSITNFDTVNDTGHECHGFEIEIEDCTSLDITHTYNYNHYGAPNITEDDSVPGHPKCFVRWESKKNPDGSWASYTAIPSGPIDPTNGHQFTNPNVNFGGEHFGVGYRVAVGKVSYNWLIDNGQGQLVRGGSVQVAAPKFTYFPGGGGNVGQVQAEIKPPPAPPVKEFGPAVWVKEIRTTSHNNEKVELRDLVSDDPDDPNDKNWRNGEPDEVEVEWQLLQEEFGKGDGGANGNLEAARENLNNGDEVVTRRYEFYEYIGPFDEESGEAKAEKVGPDDIHGVGIKTVNGVEVDLSTLEIVGEYKGAQMAAIDVDAFVSLIDHLSEGEINQPYVARRVVIQGSLPFNAVFEGELPSGMEFDAVLGILDGTPEESGEFQFKLTVNEGELKSVSKNYTLTVLAAGEEAEARYLVDTSVEPLNAGTASGDGSFAAGSEVTVSARPAPGYAFKRWVDNHKIVSTDAEYSFNMDVNHSLIAHFEPLESVDLQSWIIAEFGALANDPEATGLDKDYDNDGETTLEEYAFGHHPTVADARGPELELDDVNGFSILFDRPTNHLGLSYEVEIATDLGGPWNSGAGFTEQVSSAVHESTETVKTRSLLPTESNIQQFFRIRVTLNP
jgi:hypothetical protein